MRDGIETAGRKRLTAQQAKQSKPSAAAGAVALDGLKRIVGAGRMKAARPAEQRAKRGLVGAHGEKADGGAQIFSKVAGGGADGNALRSKARSSSLSARKSDVATEARG